MSVFGVIFMRQRGCNVEKTALSETIGFSVDMKRTRAFFCKKKLV